MSKSQKSQQLKIDYQQAFDTPGGQRVLEDIMSYCHVLQPLTGSIDTNSIMIREGRRDVALTILQKLNWDERKFLDSIEGDTNV